MFCQYIPDGQAVAINIATIVRIIGLYVNTIVILRAPGREAEGACKNNGGIVKLR